MIGGHMRHMHVRCGLIPCLFCSVFLGGMLFPNAGLEEALLEGGRVGSKIVGTNGGPTVSFFGHMGAIWGWDTAKLWVKTFP